MAGALEAAAVGAAGTAAAARRWLGRAAVLNLGDLPAAVETWIGLSAQPCRQRQEQEQRHEIVLGS
jgi:hypothetical protein